MKRGAERTGTALTIAAGIVAVPWLVVSTLGFVGAASGLEGWGLALGAVCMALLWTGLFVRWRARRAPAPPSGTD